MLCPYCGKESEQQPTANVFAAVGCNPAPITAFSVQVADGSKLLNVNHQSVLGCFGITATVPHVTFIQW